ncbi:hypothetical protein OGM63_24775 [Plectonema radiosum NIES-515]|uniref:Transposase n=1 Tax=Plectonema radiosum NIES-515 TaxID=2986073 RepID=A0ABT3B5P0_9CYAN|nr:hypothetical protein [Plectonema radiosum]MCV3216678.1 hypothetical protein [Plectonema radiosum NIES-515]
MQPQDRINVQTLSLRDRFSILLSTEEYWVERNQKKYYYWRYCWMEGRKIRRCHIGSVRSLKALGNYQAVVRAIARNQSPQEIKKLI